MPRPSQGRRITCRECQHAAVLVPTPGGGTVLLDTEVMTVVPTEGQAVPLPARRKHAEMCLSYQRGQRDRKRPGL